MVVNNQFIFSIRLVVVILFNMFCTALVLGQNTSGENASASANLLGPIKIENISDLNFGIIVKSSSGEGSVDINAFNGTVNYINITNVGEDFTSRASFQVYGEIGAIYSISISDAGGDNMPDKVTLIKTGDGFVETMTAQLNHNKTSIETNTISSDSDSNLIYVGGKLIVGPSQAPGSYQGSFNVVVSYQ